MAKQVFTLVLNPETGETDYISSMDLRLALQLTQQIIIASEVEKAKHANTKTDGGNRDNGNKALEVPQVAEGVN